MKNFLLGVFLTLLVVAQVGTSYIAFCPHYKRIYFKSNPKATVLEVVPEIQQQTQKEERCHQFDPQV